MTSQYLDPGDLEEYGFLSKDDSENGVGIFVYGNPDVEDYGPFFVIAFHDPFGGSAEVILNSWQSVNALIDDIWSSAERAFGPIVTGDEEELGVLG